MGWGGLVREVKEWNGIRGVEWEGEMGRREESGG